MASLGPAILLIAAAGGFAAGTASQWSAPPVVRGDLQMGAPSRAAPASRSGPASGANIVADCYAVDGDTLRCGGERIRLIGIDSPEMPGHCREGRRCVAGDPYAAKAALSGAVAASMRIRRFGTDHYGRTLALVRGPLGDLSCGQLRHGHAVYRADWDVDGAMMKGCG